MRYYIVYLRNEDDYVSVICKTKNELNNVIAKVAGSDNYSLESVDTIENPLHASEFVNDDDIDLELGV